MIKVGIRILGNKVTKAMGYKGKLWTLKIKQKLKYPMEQMGKQTKRYGIQEDKSNHSTISC